METIKNVLMRRDKMTSEEADEQIEVAREDFNQRVAEGDFSVLDDFCADWFGLEPDYIEEFIH